MRLINILLIILITLSVSSDLRASGFIEAARAVLKKYDKFLFIFLFKGHYVNAYVDGDTCLFVESGSLFSIRKGRGEARFWFSKFKKGSKKDFLALKKYRDQKKLCFPESHTTQVNKTFFNAYGKSMTEGYSRGVPDDSKKIISLLGLGSFKIKTKKTLQVATQSCWQNSLDIFALAFGKDHALNYELDSQIWAHSAFDMQKFLAEN